EGPRMSHFIAVKQELPTQNQQPEPERKPQRPLWNPCAEHGSADGSNYAARNQFHQQTRRVSTAPEHVRTAADERNRQAKSQVSSHHLRWAEVGQAQQRGTSQRPSPR